MSDHASSSPTPEPLLSERDAATILGLTPRTLQAWRARGDGPAFVRISSRCVRYQASALDNWIQDRIRRSTADSGDQEER
jgi:predicted DNA-binding transcriptional regulator AlpA